MFDLTASGCISLTSEHDEGALLDHPPSPVRAAQAAPTADGAAQQPRFGPGASRSRLARLRRAIMQDPDAFIALRFDPAMERLADTADLFR